MKAAFFILVFGAHSLAAFGVETASSTLMLAIGSLNGVGMLSFVLVELHWGPGPVGFNW